MAGSTADGLRSEPLQREPDGISDTAGLHRGSISMPYDNERLVQVMTSSRAPKRREVRSGNGLAVGNLGICYQFAPGWAWIVSGDTSRNGTRATKTGAAVFRRSRFMPTNTEWLRIARLRALIPVLVAVLLGWGDRPPFS